jgi:hypothetical protein
MRFFKWLFSWKTIRRFLIGLVCLVTLLALAWSVENFLGNRAWEKYKAELKAKGENLEWKATIPPPVPDEQNLAMAPIFQRTLSYKYAPGSPQLANSTEQSSILSTGIGRPMPGTRTTVSRDLLDLKAFADFYRGNTNYPQTTRPVSDAEQVLIALSQFEPELNDIREAAKRPYSRFPIHYEQTIAMLLPHLSYLKTTSTILWLRAAAELKSGQVEQAFNDVKLAFHLADSIKDEPVLVSKLVRLAMFSGTLDDIKEGIRLHVWRESDLIWFQDYLSRTDLLAEYKRAMRGERNFSIEISDQMSRGQLPQTSISETASINLPMKIVPRGWIRWNELLIAKWHQEITFAAVDETSHRVFPDVVSRGQKTIENKNRNPYTILAKMLFPALIKVSQRAAETQTKVDQALIACALERYYIAHKSYPENLQELVPQFLGKLPHDVITGAPMKYERTVNGFYKIYSVGWDQKDDGGKVPEKKKPDLNSDWVWQFQETNSGS